MNLQKPHFLRLLKVLDGLLSLMVLALAGYVTDQFYKAMESGHSTMFWTPLAVMFLLMAAAQGLLVLRPRAMEENRIEILRHAGYAAVFIACGVLVLLSRQNAPGVAVSIENNYKDFHLQAATLLYEAAMIASRLLSIHRDRTRTSAIVNLLAIAAIVFCLWDAEIITLTLTIAVQTVAHVAALAFVGLNLTTLRKIVRKTYAAEIMAGMALLIVTMSILLAYEEGIGSFGNAMWYCFAIVTTIGFGDYSAVTPVGRFLSVILGMYGIVVVALITSIITNYYNETKSEGDDKQSEGAKDA